MADKFEKGKRYGGGDMTKDWIGNQRSVFGTMGASNHSEKERQCNDY